MKKLRIVFILLMLVNCKFMFSQGRIFIAKQDGLEFTMDVDYYNTIKSVCDFVLNGPTPDGDQYKVTIYFRNNSGKKLNPNMTQGPLIRINAPNSDCGSYNWNVDFHFEVPVNSGDVDTRTNYYVISSGKQSSIIITDYVSFGNYKFVDDANKPNGNTNGNSNYKLKSYGNDVVEPNNKSTNSNTFNPNQTSGTFDGGTWKKLPNGMYEVITGGDEAEIISAADFKSRYTGNNAVQKNNKTDNEDIKLLQDLYNQLDAQVKQLKSMDPSTDTRELDKQLENLKQQINELRTNN